MAHLVVGVAQVAPVTSARYLGVYLDSDMTTKTHVTRLVSSCFGNIRQIHRIHRSLPRSTLTMLSSSFIMSKLDYCNVALVGLTRCDLDRLQSVINAAARLTVGGQHYDHISPLLVDLHWLWMAERIQYKLCVLVYRCLHGSAPCYLQQTVCLAASMESWCSLWSVPSSDLMVPATRRSTLGDCALTVAGPRAWNNLPDVIHHWPLSDAHSRLIFFSSVFT